MSEYCYRCTSCGLFSEYCKCKEFKDPMAQWKDMGELEMMQEMRKDEI